MNKKRISQLSLLVAVFALLLSGCDNGAVAKKTSDVAERTGAPNSSPPTILPPAALPTENLFPLHVG